MTPELQKDLVDYVKMVARLIKDGEELENGEDFDMESDEAVDTVADLVNIARDLADRIEDGDVKEVEMKALYDALVEAHERLEELGDEGTALYGRIARVLVAHAGLMGHATGTADKQ